MSPPKKDNKQKQKKKVPNSDKMRPKAHFKNKGQKGCEKGPYWNEDNPIMNKKLFNFQT